MVVKHTGALAILTRPHGKNEALANRLGDSGIDTLVMPALSIHPMQCDPTLLPHPEEYDLVVFVSGTAALLYLQQLAQAGVAGPWPAHTLAAAVGRASAEPLYKARSIPSRNILHPDADAASHDSEALWTVLEPRLPAAGRVLIVRGQAGREWLGQRFEQAGARVHRYSVYRREPRCWTSLQAGALKDGLASCRTAACLVTSSEGADAIHVNIQRYQLDKLWEGVRFVTIHQRVASRLQFWFATAPGKVPAPYIRVCTPDDEAIFQAIQLSAS